MNQVSAPASWLLPLSKGINPALRMFCFPYAGGGAQMFSGWPAQLPKDIEIFGVQPPGRGSRIGEPFIRKMSVMAEEVVQAILPLLNRPFIFFGHSLGALLSFEVTHRLQAVRARMPVHLFISGVGAPHLPPIAAPIYQLPDDEFMQKLREYNGTPPEVFDNVELLQFLLPILRADFEVADTYRCKSRVPIGSPITVLAGSDDRETPPDYVQAWRQHTSAVFRSEMFPGGHFFFQTCSDSFFRSLCSYVDQVTTNCRKQ
jgi:medium-chain acyl-[acyl-carrier-protein] hydrolase